MRSSASKVELTQSDSDAVFVHYTSIAAVQGGQLGFRGLADASVCSLACRDVGNADLLPARVGLQGEKAWTRLQHNISYRDTDADRLPFRSNTRSRVAQRAGRHRT